MQNESPLFIVGDLHGYREVLARQLRYAGLAKGEGVWTGDDAQLWFMGDFTDRGPDGIGVIELIMRLQQDAAAKGGQVRALLGNHDLGLLGARLLHDAPTNGPHGTFYQDWKVNGGVDEDLRRLEAHHIKWLQALDGMAHVGGRLLMHADALFYLHYGETVPLVNAGLRHLLNHPEAQSWDRLLAFAGERFAFDDRRPDGSTRARQVLAQFGGAQIVHGHTPIPLLTGSRPESVTRGYVYAGGLAVDVDGGIYKGGPGFVYEVPALGVPALGEFKATRA